LYVWIDATFHKSTIKIATGTKGGAYYKYAEKYQKLLRKEGINLIIVETEGSVEAQNKLLAKEVDFAFVQSGTEKKSIAVLANVAYEPVWIFHRDNNLTSLKMLKNQKIAIGNKKSGTLPIAEELLTVSGINTINNKLLNLSTKEGLKAFKEKRVDVLFYVASYPAELVTKLIVIPDVYLLDFPNASAYRQYFLKNDKDYEVLKLEAHGFDLPNKIPKQSYTMLGKTTLLATRDDMSMRMSRLLLQVSEKVHREADMFHGKNIFPNVAMLKMKQHEASVDYFKQKINYLERKIGFWYAQTVNDIYSFAWIFLVPIITIFAFVVEVVLPAYAHFSRKKINEWYYVVNEIDTGLNFLTLEEAKVKRDFLENLLLEIRGTDNIPAIHMGPFYTLQNQIVTIIVNLERRIEELS
ncbi:MAG: hypothetical protein K0U38_03505, partial [Epsilonproteobacteria bacterium]|nr:hypothetical protein [Campylobacterota bacterium]